MQQTNHGELWDTYIEAVRKACANNNPVLGQKILGLALADAEDFQEIDPRLVSCLYSVAGLCSSLNLYTEAAHLYKQLLELKEKILGPHHPDVTDSMEKVALSQLTSNSEKENRPQDKRVISLQAWAARMGRLVVEGN